MQFYFAFLAYVKSRNFSTGHGMNAGVMPKCNRFITLLLPVPCEVVSSPILETPPTITPTRTEDLSSIRTGIWVADKRVPKAL